MRKCPLLVSGILLVLAAAPSAGPAAGFPAAGPAKPAPRKMLLVINFDVEDYTTPASEGIDDIPKWLAEILTEEGATGTFYVIGEKARSLEARGRRDVIAAMAKHDIGSHTNFGSFHPTVTEVLEKAGWADGVTSMLERESAGVKELERIFGVPVATMGRHGGSYGPQLVAALGTLGLGFSGSPVGLPGRTSAWFANALNFSFQYGGYDDVFWRDDLFEPAFEKIKAELPELAKTRDAVSFFCGHPTKIRSEQFWDFNFYGGKNTPPAEWKTPVLRPLAAMETAKKNFRRLVRWLKGRDDIEVTTFRDLMGRYEGQKKTVTAAEMKAVAAEVLRTKALLPAADLSPAEILSALADALAYHRAEGVLPADLEIRHPLGPAAMPEETAAAGPLTPIDVYALAIPTCGEIGRTGALPAVVQAGARRLGPGRLLPLFAAAYLDLTAGQMRAGYEIPVSEPYPRTHEKTALDLIRGYKSWPVHKPDLDMARILEFTRLQLWTLKPARLK
jgi:hypothetical protein